MLHLQDRGWLWLGVLALAGCRSTPPHIEPISGPPPPALAAPAEPAKGETPRRPSSSPPRWTPAGAKPEVWPADWTNRWITLGEWASWNRLAPPVLVTERPPLTLEVSTPAGRLAVAANSPMIRWDGVVCWLAHAPITNSGSLKVQTLDVQKTLQPLLRRSQAPPPAGFKIVIDPGHGGTDTGTRSGSGSGLEKEFTLDWALRLRRLLTGRGCTVLLTRTNDVNRSIPERVAVADAVQADLFLSLHFNSLPDAAYSGIETYCLTPVGLPSHLVRDDGDDLRQVYPNNAYDDANLAWAFRLHAGLVHATATTDRGVRRARFVGVLRWQSRPAVLLEGGYLSNAEEARKIATPAYRQELAEAVAKAIVPAGQSH